MRIVCEQTILMKYHTLFFFENWERWRKICHLLQSWLALIGLILSYTQDNLLFALVGCLQIIFTFFQFLVTARKNTLNFLLLLCKIYKHTILHSILSSTDFLFKINYFACTFICWFFSKSTISLSHSSADFFQNQLFRKTLSGIPSECQTVWIQIKPGILLGLIWVQTVCKCYQQTTPVGKELIYKCFDISK